MIERIGIGTDVHRLADGGPLVIGGVRVPFDRHLEGHSDGDVVLHAITDGLLGAAGLPDIGEMFPDTDARYRGADSAQLLMEAMEKVRGAGWGVVNVDVIVHAERPKLSAYKGAMRANVARILGLSEDRVSFKAKTNEGMDAVGRGEAIGCTCVVGLGRILG